MFETREILRDHGIGVGKYKLNGKIRNFNLSNPTVTKVKDINGSSVGSSTPFVVFSPDNAYFYWMNSSGTMEKRSTIDGSMIWSTPLTNAANDAVVDSQGNVWVLSGYDLKKVTTSGSATTYTFTGYSLGIDSSDNLYVFSVTSLTKVNSSGTQVWNYNHSLGTATTSTATGALASNFIYYVPGVNLGVVKVDYSGNLISSVTTNINGHSPLGIVDSQDNGYFSGNSIATKINPSLSIINSHNYTYVTGLEKDKHGNIYTTYNPGSYYVVALNYDLTPRVTYSPGTTYNAIGVDSNGYVWVPYNLTYITQLDTTYTILG